MPTVVVVIGESSEFSLVPVLQGVYQCGMPSIRLVEMNADVIIKEIIADPEGGLSKIIRFSGVSVPQNILAKVQESVTRIKDKQIPDNHKILATKRVIIDAIGADALIQYLMNTKHQSHRKNIFSHIDYVEEVESIIRIPDIAIVGQPVTSPLISRANITAKFQNDVMDRIDKLTEEPRVVILSPITGESIQEVLLSTYKSLLDCISCEVILTFPSKRQEPNKMTSSDINLLLNTILEEGNNDKQE